MTDAEYHQQQLEQQEEEETSVRIKDEDGYELGLHIWGEDKTVYCNIRTNPSYLSLFLTVEQAEAMVKLLDNALRRAKK